MYTGGTPYFDERTGMYRNIKPENFYNKLKKHKDVVSLQIQPDFMPSYLDGRDWLDTAKKLAALDAIVTIDTGVAHLAEPNPATHSAVPYR